MPLSCEPLAEKFRFCRRNRQLDIFVSFSAYCRRIWVMIWSTSSLHSDCNFATPGWADFRARLQSNAATHLKALTQIHMGGFASRRARSDEAATELSGSESCCIGRVLAIIAERDSRASNTKGCTGFSRSRRCRIAEHFPDFGSRWRACRRAMDAELFQQRPDRHQPASGSGRNLNWKIAFLRA